MHIDMSMQQTSGFPLFMVAITLAQVGVFVAWSDYVRRGALGGPVSLAVNMVGDWPKCGDQRGQLWRYVGYQFVHADASHIIYNAIVQLTLGIPVELVHGSPRICGIYLVSVVVGALAVVFATPQYIIVGAGGVYSLFGVHLGNYYEARGRRPPTPTLGALGGFAAGFVFALIFLHEMVDHPMEHCIRRLAWVVAAASVAFLVGWNVVNDPPKGLPAFYTDRENLPCCFQALYCDGLDQADWRDWKESFVCTSSGNKHVLWDGLGADAPDDTFSCSMLEDVLDA
ncbi:serine-type endopeptidase [Aureococcus anophagefferens]|nr:serine-type endopeptidase [Aureococcus anophagefferens]